MLATSELLLYAEMGFLSPASSYRLLRLEQFRFYHDNLVQYYAEQTRESAKSVHIKTDSSKQFLTRLERVPKETFSGDEIKEMVD